jgi:hypothetical protein
MTTIAAKKFRIIISARNIIDVMACKEADQPMLDENTIFLLLDKRMATVTGIFHQVVTFCNPMYFVS